MRLCHNCGQALERGVIYCTDCGAPVPLQPTEAMGASAQKEIFSSTEPLASPQPKADDHQSALPPIPPAPSFSPIDDFLPPPLAPPRRGSKRAPVIIASLIVLALAALAAALMLSSSNKPPVLDPIEVSAALVQTGETVTLTARARDADGDALNYQWSSSAGEIRGNGDTVTLDTSAVDASSGRADVRVTLTVSDGRGGSVSTDRPVTVMPVTVINTSPTTALPMTLDLEADHKSATAGETINLRASVANRDPAQMTYEWKTSAGTLQTNGPRASLETSSIQMSGSSKKITVTLTVRDSNQESRTDSEIINLVAAQPANWPPSVTLRASRSAVYQGDDVEITADAADRDGDTLTYVWNTSHGQLTGSGNRMTLKTWAIAPGQVEVWATVADGRGESATDKITVSVVARPNRPPVINGITADRARVDAGQRVALTARVSDPESDSLDYIWKSSAGEIRGNGERATLDTSTIDIDSGSLQVTVSLTVRDQNGGAATDSAFVTVVRERIAEPPRAGPLSVTAQEEGENIIITLTGRAGRPTSSSGTITVFYAGPGNAGATGMLPASPVLLDFGAMRNLSKDRISFAETPGPSNRYSRMRIRIRPKNRKETVQFTINWTIR